MENKFKPFDKVLVRDKKECNWNIDFFSYEDKVKNAYPYHCVGCNFAMCIPYEGNEHLLGTTDDYVEPFEPKDGDFVVDKEDDMPFIYRATSDAMWDCGAYFALCHDDASGIDLVYDAYSLWARKANLRPATDKEKELLLSKLHEDGKDWDAEKKKVVELKWTPKMGESYCGIEFDEDILGFRPYYGQWSDSPYEKSIFKKGWVFKFSEESDTLISNLASHLNRAVKNVK